MSKYHSVRTGRYDSKKECIRAQELRMLEQAGEITNLREKVKFVLAPAVRINGRMKPELRYYADFVYDQGGETIVEDVKGTLTDVYKIKRHLMKSVWDIDIKET